MPSNYSDRTAETSTSTGTGNFTLAGAITGYQAFATGVTDGASVCYCITDGTNWETGEGTFTAPSTLSRDLVYQSSNADALVNFAAGSKTVFVTLPSNNICDLGLAVAVRTLALIQ